MRAFSQGALLLFFVSAGWAQTETFDVFRFRAPRGWKLLPGKDDYGMERLVNNQFCQIALYRSVASTGSAAGDFDREWNSVKQRFTVLRENPRERGKAEGWTVTNGSASVEAPGTGKFVTTVQVYSGFGVRAAVVVNSNHGGCQSEFQSFLGSLVVEAGKTPTTVTAAPAASAGGWASSAEANPELGAWPAEIRSDYVQFSGPGMTARIYYPITITDAMRSRGDMRINVWNMLVAPQFRAGEIRYWDNGPGATGPYASGGNFLIANAVDATNGSRVVVGMNYATDNGMMRAVVAIARDEATFNRLAGTPEKMEKLVRLNMFVVPPKELNGRWTSSFTSAAEMYNVASGSYAGLAVAAASLDISFDNGRYQSKGKATVGRVGSIQSSSDAEAGSYQLNGSLLTLLPTGKEKTAYLAWFEAVRGGMMLHLVNNQYRGSRWDLLRAK
jgi:hypothetical protein